MAKIMFVDDEVDIGDAFKIILNGAGYQVILAKSGQDALNKLAKDLPDLVLIDMFMPEMSGRRLLEKIRADPKLKDLKCAFLTVAEFGKGGKEELKRLNSLDYIMKPFVKKDLLERVKKMILMV